MNCLFDPDAFRRAIGVLLTCVALTACSAEKTDDNVRQLPTDQQVVADVTPHDDDRVVEVRVVPGKSGEAYFHDRDRVWYFDRGVVVRREAGVEGFPEAVIAVGGLARYIHTDDGYQYLRFLTTYNAYEGISAPSDEDLAEFVEENLGRVFVGRAHNIYGVESVSRDPNRDIDWHSPTSFSASFAIRYIERRNNTTIEERDGVFDIRFYKQTVDDGLSWLDATERSRAVVASETHDQSVIDRMKSLATNFL